MDREKRYIDDLCSITAAANIIKTEAYRSTDLCQLIIVACTPAMARALTIVEDARQLCHSCVCASTDRLREDVDEDKDCKTMRQTAKMSSGTRTACATAAHRLSSTAHKRKERGPNVLHLPQDAVALVRLVRRLGRRNTGELDTAKLDTLVCYYCASFGFW